MNYWHCFQWSFPRNPNLNLKDWEFKRNLQSSAPRISMKHPNKLPINDKTNSLRNWKRFPKAIAEGFPIEMLLRRRDSQRNSYLNCQRFYYLFNSKKIDWFVDEIVERINVDEIFKFRRWTIKNHYRKEFRRQWQRYCRRNCLWNVRLKYLWKQWGNFQNKSQSNSYRNFRWFFEKNWR